MVETPLFSPQRHPSQPYCNFLSNTSDIKQPPLLPGYTKVFSRLMERIQVPISATSRFARKLIKTWRGDCQSQVKVKLRQTLFATFLGSVYYPKSMAKVSWETNPCPENQNTEYGCCPNSSNVARLLDPVTYF